MDSFLAFPPIHKVLLLAHYPNIFEIFYLSSMAWVARMRAPKQSGNLVL